MKIILLTIFLSHFLLAQERLQNFIDEAITKSPLLKAAENKYLAKEFLAIQKGILPDPVLGFTQWIEPVETRVGPQQNIFSLTQKIPFPGKLSLKEEIVKSEAEKDKLLFDSAVRDLKYSIKINWFDLYLADQSLSVLEDYHILLKDFVDAAAAKYATGQGIQAQVLKAQVEHSTIQSRILDLQRKRYINQANLNHLRNLNPDFEISPVTFIDTSFIDQTEFPELLKLYHNRQEYKAAEKDIQQSELKENLAYRNWFPDLTIQANYITVADDNTMAGDAGKDAWGVMLGINLPLWFSGRSAQVDQSRKNVLMREAQVENVKSQVQSEISDFKYRAESTEETINLYQNILIPQAENSLKSALAAYRSGSLGFLELLDAERMLLQLRLTFLREQVNYRKIITGLERAVGGEL